MMAGLVTGVRPQTYAVWVRLEDGSWDKIMGRLSPSDAASLMEHYRRKGCEVRRTAED